MNINNISVGKNAPQEVNVIIEVSMGTDPVKYEMDKDSGAMVVDRILHTAMYYPCNYGFVPHTLSDDGDPVDVLVATNVPIVPGAVMAVRPIGVLMMEDEAGQDEKILSVPIDKLHPFYADIANYDDLPKTLIDQISHFFEHYKDLEKNKWVKVTGWDNAAKAIELIEQGIRVAAEKNAA